MNLNKRGVGSAIPAAILLIVIMGLLIFFIVLLPPEERAELLGETSEDGNVTDGGSTSDLEEAVPEETLLEVSPGRVDYLAQEEIEHPLASVNVYTLTESQVVADLNSMSLKHGVFSEKTGTLQFGLDDLEHTENVLLSFSVSSIDDRLTITLNDQEIFDNYLEIGNIQPIDLPQHLLQQNNVLEFSVSSPGGAFWRTNEAILQNIKVVGDITDISAQRSKNIFLVSETEYSNLDKVVLKFQPDCYYDEVGRLSIMVNGLEVYNAVPDCALELVPIEFSPGIVNQGENEIIFFTEKGRYFLSHVLVESRLKEVDFPTYYFDISNEQYEDVQDGDRRLRLEVDFVDVTTTKRGDFVYNGHVLPFDTKEVSEAFDLSDDIVRGTNSLKIRPQKTLEVREVRVEIIK